MRHIAFALTLLLPGLAAAEEWTFELRLQPDDSGSETTSRSVELEDGELTIEESGTGRYDERDATAEEAEFLQALIRDRIADWSFAATERIPRPHVEVIFEWDGEGRAVEVTEVYRAGAVPPDLVAAQRRFFDGVYD